MHRFYVPPEDCTGPIITLKGSEAHHAADVLRVRPGENISVLDGAGHEYRCRVQTVSKKAVAAQVLEKSSAPAAVAAVTLIQAVPKARAMDLILQKATELGAARIIPLLSERSVVQLDSTDAEAKAGKWQQVVIEALKQCGQPWLPKVESPVRLSEMLQPSERFDLSLVGSLQPGSKHPREYFRRFAEMNHRLPASVALWVGPEGDFTPGEMEQITGSGALPITMGNLVLRCDTAALYGLSVISYELQSR